MNRIAAAMSSVSYNSNKNTGPEQRLVQRTHMATPLATYNVALEKFDKNNNDERFWQVVGELTEKGIKPDVTTWNMMIGRCVAKRQWDKAYKLLQSMRDAGYNPTIGTYYNMLKVSDCLRRLEEYQLTYILFIFISIIFVIFLIEKMKRLWKI
jgi:pentatricopeptide repeat protein